MNTFAMVLTELAYSLENFFKMLKENVGEDVETLEPLVHCWGKCETVQLLW